MTYSCNDLWSSSAIVNDIQCVRLYCELANLSLFRLVKINIDGGLETIFSRTRHQTVISCFGSSDADERATACLRSLCLFRICIGKMCSIQVQIELASCHKFVDSSLSWRYIVCSTSRTIRCKTDLIAQDSVVGIHEHQPPALLLIWQIHCALHWSSRNAVQRL